MMKHPAEGVPVRSLTVLIAVILSLIGCQALQGANPAPTLSATDTPWPTLVPVFTVEASAENAGPVGPQLEDKFRADIDETTVALYPLEGKVDRPVRVEVVVLEGTLDPYIIINNQNGDTLATVDQGAATEPEVIGQFQFPGDGYYELGIGSVTGVGEVGVSVYELEPAAVEGGGVFEEMGQELQATLTLPASYHTFRLPVERGQRFDLAAVAQTEGLDLAFDLYSPDGELLASRDDQIGKDPYLWDFMPDQSGIYTAVVRNFDESTGDYKVLFTQSTDALEAQLGTRADLETAAWPQPGTWLSFDAHTLDGITLDARPLGGGMDVVVSLYDKYGNLIAKADDEGIGTEESLALVQLPADGRYQIEVSSRGEAGTVEYLLRLTRGIDLESGGRVAPGPFGHDGEMWERGTVHAFVFDASEGELVGIVAEADRQSDLDLAFELYGPDGYLLTVRDDTVGLDPILDAIALPLAGQYVVLLRNLNGTTGPYELFITQPEAPATAPAGDAPSG